MKLLSVAAGRLIPLIATFVLAGLLLAGLLWPAAASQAAPSFVYSSPRPGATLVSAGTTITVRYPQPVDPAALSPAVFDVRGAESGAHAGDVVLAGDGRTVIFTPHAPFAHGERVTAAIGQLQTPGGAPLTGGDLAFTVAARPAPLDPAAPPTALQPLLESAAAPPLTPTTPLTTARDYVTIPGAFPPISVTTPASGTADGYLFLGHFALDRSPFHFGAAPPYLLILDDEGEPVFYREIQDDTTVFDFKKQPGGELTYGQREGGFRVLDHTYTEIMTYTAGNGYETDIHDFQLRPDGRALLMIYDPQHVDMSEIVEGGDPDAVVIGLVIQEVDADNNVLFQWRSWDHIPITDTTMDLTRSTIDYVHGNSVDWDHDGNLIISSRLLDEVTKIDRETGEIIWRLGGKANQFTFIGDGEPFFDQHDARRLNNGHLTLYDNRTAPDSTYSRGVEYELDEEAMTARRVWEYRSTGGEASIAMGNHQRLPNGNSLIAWGILTTTLTEVTPAGQKAFEMRFGYYGAPDIIGLTYRAFRFPWEGAPTTRPALVARTELTETAVYYSWNGATAVDSWRLYAGADPGDLDLIDAQARDGFETRSAVADPDLCFFRVEALDAGGAVLETSAMTIAERCVAGRVFLPAVPAPGP